MTTMHQCDYCCWLNPVYTYCECPYGMRDKACRDAREKKIEQEKMLSYEKSTH